MTDGVEITDEMLRAYSDEVYEKDDSRPVLIEPGVYSAELVDWSKQFSPQFRKFTVVMHFRIGTDVIPGWFNIEPSESKTTIKAGWKSNFLRMYQACLDKRLDRRDRISMRPFEDKPLVVEVVSIQRDSNQDPMAEVNHYSRVKRVLQVEEVIPF